MTAPARIPPALEAAAASLRSRYAGRHPAEVVEKLLLEEYSTLAATARVQDFVPIFAERAARRRLEAEITGRPSASVARTRRRTAPTPRRAAAGSE